MAYVYYMHLSLTIIDDISVCFNNIRRYKYSKISLTYIMIITWEEADDN